MDPETPVEHVQEDIDAATKPGSRAEDSRLCRLPRELRNLIYEYMCSTPTFLTPRPATAHPSDLPCPLALALANAHLRAEFRDVFMKHPIEITFDNLGRFVNDFYLAEYGHADGGHLTIHAPWSWTGACDKDLDFTLDILPLLRLMVQSQPKFNVCAVTTRRLHPSMGNCISGINRTIRSLQDVALNKSHPWFDQVQRGNIAEIRLCVKYKRSINCGAGIEIVWVWTIKPPSHRPGDAFWFHKIPKHLPKYRKAIHCGEHRCETTGPIGDTDTEPDYGFPDSWPSGSSSAESDDSLESEEEDSELDGDTSEMSSKISDDQMDDASDSDDLDQESESDG